MYSSELPLDFATKSLTNGFRGIEFGSSILYSCVYCVSWIYYPVKLIYIAQRYACSLIVYILPRNGCFKFIRKYVCPPVCALLLFAPFIWPSYVVIKFLVCLPGRTVRCVRCVRDKISICWSALTRLRHSDEIELPDQRVVGLTNRGNTCYFNSAMQMVIYTPYLKELIDEVLNSGRHNSMKMTVAFSKVLAAAEKNSEKLDFATNGLLKVVFETSTRFKEYSQQDMHELWRLILNRIKDEEQEQKMDKRKISGERETPLSMDRIFGGHFITVYVCDNCTLPYHLCEPFIDISIPVIYESDKSFNLNEEDRENNRKGLLGDHTEMRDYCSAMDSIVKPLKGGTTVGGTELNEGKLKTIEEGLACLTRTEQLEGGFLCRKCANEEYARNPEATSDEMSTTATKKLAIFNLPAILTINLKRFQFTDDGRFQKVRHPVKFDEILDLGPFCSKYIMNPANSTVYELYGVVEHHGSLDGGHYTAYVKVPVSHGDPKRQKLSKQEYQEIISARRHRVRGNLQKKDEVDIGDANEPQTIVSIVNKLREKAREKKGRKKMQQGLENTIEPAPQVLANVNWQWYHISDSFFSKVSFDEVQRAEAFLLFYERR